MAFSKRYLCVKTTLRLKSLLQSWKKRKLYKNKRISKKNNIKIAKKSELSKSYNMQPQVNLVVKTLPTLLPSKLL
jgi:hypothetical protein